MIFNNITGLYRVAVPGNIEFTADEKGEAQISGLLCLQAGSGLMPDNTPYNMLNTKEY